MKRIHWLIWWKGEVIKSRTLSTDAAGQLDVLGHNGDKLSMDGKYVGILKDSNQVSLWILYNTHREFIGDIYMKPPFSWGPIFMLKSMNFQINRGGTP